MHKTKKKPLKLKRNVLKQLAAPTLQKVAGASLYSFCCFTSTPGGSVGCGVGC